MEDTNTAIGVIASYTIWKMEHSKNASSGVRKTLMIWIPGLRGKQLLKNGKQEREGKENKKLKDWEQMKSQVWQEE